MTSLKTVESPPSRAVMRRVSTASAVGTTIEFYDFMIYGTAAALVFPTVFFPVLGNAAGTVASFATFGVAFVARPLGSIIFGHFGDRVGRKRTLITTLLLMGIATVLIGVLPSAHTIGILAPIALVTLRVCQGLAVGGEWAGATLLTAEYAPPHQRGFYGVFPQLGPPLGFGLASATFLIVNRWAGETSDAFLAWGWRVPFLASALLVLIGLWVRLKVDETPVFTRQQAEAKATGRESSPVIAVFREQPRELLLAAGAMTMLFAFFYLGTAFLTSYGTSAMGLDRETVLSLGILGALVFTLSVVISGTLSDKIGRRSIVLFSCIVSIPWALVLFPILDGGTAWDFFVGLSGTLFIMGLSYGPAGSMLPEMFRTEYRYTGAGTAYSIAAAVGGGAAPILASWISEIGESYQIGIMLACFGVLSSICLLFLTETNRRAMEVKSES